MSFLDNLTAQLPFGNKTIDAEYFFALDISLSQITAAVWSITGRQLDILGKSTLSYEGSDDLVAKVPTVLDKALGALEIEVQKVLFGVPNSWSLDDNLKEPYSKLLQKILKECDLSPLAYVTTTHAIAFSLQKQEGVPTAAILLSVGDFIESTLLRGGKAVESRLVKRSDHLFDDIEKTLGQFTQVDVLPSKILLFAGRENENLSKIKDDLMSYPWMSKLSFLHFPKIELLPEGVSIQSIITAGAYELYPEINLKHSFSTILPISSVAKGPLTSMSKEENVGENTLEETVEENLGFVKGDIKKQVLDGGDVEDEEEEVVEKEKEANEENVEEVNLVSRQENFQPVAQIGSMLTKMKHKLVPIVDRLKFRKLLKSRWIFLPVVLVLLIAAYLLLVKAIVTIYIEPRILEKVTEVIADPKAISVDGVKQIIPASVVEITLTGTGKDKATGSKQIGDPAKGKVVIYNLTNSRVSLSQGTSMSANNLKFTLDSSVQIASQSSSVGADFTTVITPGKTSPVGVTASVIGPEGNLPAATEMIVAGYSKSQVVARVEESLSGGTSKEVTVVTSDDQKKLQAKVIDDLRAKAQSELQGKQSDGKKIIPEALSVADGKYSFSKQVNDQASEFNLSATVHFKGSAYSDDDLRSIVSKLVETNIPEGFQLNLQDSETQADVVKVDKDGKLTFKAKFRAKLFPKLDVDQIKNQIKGKSIIEVGEKLKGIENILGSEVKLYPSLPAALSRIPLLERNITVIISPK